MSGQRVPDTDGARQRPAGKAGSRVTESACCVSWCKRTGKVYLSFVRLLRFEGPDEDALLLYEVGEVTGVHEADDDDNDVCNARLRVRRRSPLWPLLRYGASRK